MKSNRLLFLVMAICLASGVKAQGVMLYKGGDYLFYSISDIDSLVFANEDPKSNSIDGQKYVDLGLPSGTLWATCNVGATAPNAYGRYFAWGEHVEKLEYLPDNYYYVTPYDTHNLYKEDDPAQLYWGGKWRTPSRKQIKELIEECEWSWEKYLGTQGSRVTGPNGKSIFLPAGSYKNDSYFNKPDTAVYGSYWGREYEFLNRGNPCAVELIFGIAATDGRHVSGEYYRDFGIDGTAFCGRNIRPVYDESVEFELPSNKWSGENYTAMAISYDSGIDYGTWSESSPNYNMIVDTPAFDADYREWFDIDYELTDNSSSWTEVQAPITDWCAYFGDIYVRREFYFDSPQLPERLFLACGHDDAPCEYYLNGELIWSVVDGWNEVEVIELTPSQIALLRPGEKNVLAFHVHQNWGGMYADCGLYTDRP